MEHSLGEPPFGSRSLPPLLERFRDLANRMPEGTVSRWVMSAARRGCLAGREDPIDIEVFGDCRARLYPRSNRCEKRAFLGIKSWDALERDVISRELDTAATARPFVFVDGGANVGLYSLFAVSEARRLGRLLVVVAIEPDPVNFSRLAFNMAASAASGVHLAEVALGEARTTAMMLSTQKNRGEARLAGPAMLSSGEAAALGAVEVPVRPLADVLLEIGLDRIDLLKLDIEGAELPTLRAFFASAARELWPRVIVLEVGRQGRSAAQDLCLAAGYRRAAGTKLNAILRLDADAKFGRAVQ